MAVSEKTVGALMARQGLQGRVRKRRRGPTRADAQAEALPGPLKRDFTAERVKTNSGVHATALKALASEGVFSGTG